MSGVDLLDNIIEPFGQVPAGVVIGAGETAAAQAAGVHPEVAPILLHQHVGGDFGGAKQAV